MNVKTPMPGYQCPACGAVCSEGLWEGRRVHLDLSVRVLTPLSPDVLPRLAHNALSFVMHEDVCPYKNV